MLQWSGRSVLAFYIINTTCIGKLVIKLYFKNCNYILHLKVIEMSDFNLQFLIVTEWSATYFSTFLLVCPPACLANFLAITLQSWDGFSQNNKVDWGECNPKPLWPYLGPKSVMTSITWPYCGFKFRALWGHTQVDPSDRQTELYHQV